VWPTGNVQKKKKRKDDLGANQACTKYLLETNIKCEILGGFVAYARYYSLFVFFFHIFPLFSY
jgi:hypothetical protein